MPQPPCIPPTPASTDLSLRARFEQLMTADQLFLQHDLRLADVCRRLATNRTYLLAMLSSELHTSFTGYVNRHRVAYAQQLLATRPDMSKQEVAFLSGYATPSSFYRNCARYAPDTTNQPKYTHAT